MIRIEVTGHSIAEVSDKLLAIGNSLRASPTAVVEHAHQEILNPIMPELTDEIVFEPSVAVEATPVVEAAAVGADGLKELVLSVVRLKGRDAMVAVLDSFGVAKATDVPAEQSAELVAALEALL